MEITPKVSSSLPSNSKGESHKHFSEGIHFHFPTFKHERHTSIVDVNNVSDEQLTMGDRIADKVAATVGSWPFIIIQSIILLAWIVANILLVTIGRAWDPYPFILLNLALSFQAAYAAPFVMMSQNRQAAKDRLTADNDYKTDVKGELEICHIMEHLDHQDDIILQIVKRLEEQHAEMKEQLARLDPALVKRLAADIQQIEAEQEK